MNRAEETIEVQSPRKFAFYSSRDVGVFETPGQLFAGLCHRKDFDCVVLAHDNVAELNFMVEQCYPRDFLINNPFPNVPLQLPQNTSFYALQYTDILQINQANSSTLTTCAQSNLSPVKSDYGYWGIHAQNGYCVLSGVNVMIGWMADLSTLIAPKARSFTHTTTAHNWAQSEYIKRFFGRYASRNEQIDLLSTLNPNNLIFIDQYFREREKRRNEQSSPSRFNILYELGLLW